MLSASHAYASATITEFNHAHRSGDFPISSNGCTCFQHNNCGHGDISAITLLILSLSGCSPVNILWYTVPVDMMTFRWSHRSYQSIWQQHPPYSHPQVTLIYYIYIYIQISLNIIDIFCLHIFLLILSYCRIDFIVFGGNWLIYFPYLFISQVLSVRLWDIIRGWCVTKGM